jgi:energy-coupling factor transport system ATP-binding protein
MSAITFRDVSFAYPDGPVALQDVSLEVQAGELLLVVGSSGSGKSTLLRAVNGIVPHSTGGRFSGSVTAFGRDVQHHRPRELTEVVGFVSQDPEAQLVVDEVEHDVAFALENLGMPATAMRRRVEEALDALGIAHLRRRTPTSLSGGERQRVAIAGAIAAAPSALVLDEPTSQLDPQGADDVLAALARLNADLGTTVVLAEHRLERAAPLADRAVVVEAGHVPAPTDVGVALAGYAGAPPVVQLGRLLGWDPLPLTVRDARARAAEHPGPEPLVPSGPDPASSPGEVLAAARALTVELGGRDVLHGVDLAVHRGEVVALLGRNGAGKTTLLRALAGLNTPSRGAVEASTRVAYVPQDPSSLLFSPTVRREVGETLAQLGRRDDGAVDAWLARLGIEHLADRHPRSLAGGERQRVAIAAVAVGGAEVLLLDEPTRGMDAASRHALERAVRDHADGGGGVVLATHDVELAARCATRVVVLGDGDVVADGPGPDVLAGSLFAPQTLRVMPPFLTVADVAAALERERT